MELIWVSRILMSQNLELTFWKSVKGSHLNFRPLGIQLVGFFRLNWLLYSCLILADDLFYSIFWQTVTAQVLNFQRIGIRLVLILWLSWLHPSLIFVDDFLWEVFDLNSQNLSRYLCLYICCYSFGWPDFSYHLLRYSFQAFFRSRALCLKKPYFELKLIDRPINLLSLYWLYQMAQIVIY